MNGPVLYPCDRGTGQPMGWHHFIGAPHGAAVCIYCGRAAPLPPIQITYTTGTRET